MKKRMNGWIRGLISSVISILTIAIAYVTWGSAGPVGTLSALLCAGISAFFILILIYAIENDDFRAGAVLPFIVIAGILVAYFGQVPSWSTLAMSVLTSILALILIQEGD